ncbi:MAG: WG repeat-containing protein [Clostridia bacterium]
MKNKERQWVCKMNGKLKWIIISAIVLIIAIIITILIINESQINYSIEEIKEYNYFTLIENNKYGVIDKNGNVVIEPNYTTVQIPNPFKPIFVCITGYNQEKQEYDSIVYNDKKEELFKDYENVQAIPIDTNIDSTPYEKVTLKYKKNGKYGLLNVNGKKITDAIYESINSINYKEGCFLVKENNLVGVINQKGKTIIKTEYETITSDNYYSEKKDNKKTGFIVSKRTEDGYRYGYINYKGNTVLDLQYTELERVIEIKDNNQLYFIAFKDGQAGLIKNNKLLLNHEYEDIQYNVLSDIFIIKRNGKEGVVDKEGQTILYPEYDGIFIGGMYLIAKKDNNSLVFDLNGNKIETTVVSKIQTENPNYFITIDENNIYKVVDSNENIVIDNDYDYIEYLPGDYFIVAKNFKNGIININGKSLVEIKYDSIFRISDTNLLQLSTSSDKTIELYNLKMEKIISMSNANVKEFKSSENSNESYIMLLSETDFVYFDKNGNKLTSQDVYKNNQLFSKKINNKWGFVDKNGDIKVQNEYDMVTDFNEYGYAGIKKDGKWGVINQEGNIVQQPIYNIDWLQPSFIGKYYKINAWYGENRYSSDIIQQQ